VVLGAGAVDGLEEGVLLLGVEAGLEVHVLDEVDRRLFRAVALAGEGASDSANDGSDGPEERGGCLR
jgi:hypothetical protein